MSVDAFRPLLMFLLGGVYADLDMECLRPIDTLVENRVWVIGKEPYRHARELYGLDWLPSNAFLASVPDHPFWKHYVHCILGGDAGEEDPVAATGPVMLRNALDSYDSDKKDLSILESDMLFPLLDLSNERLFQGRADHRVLKARLATASDFPQAFAVHRWQHSWFDLGPSAPYGGCCNAPYSADRHPSPIPRSSPVRRATICLFQGTGQKAPEHGQAFRIQILLSPAFEQHGAAGREFIVSVVEEHQHRDPGKAVELHRNVMVHDHLRGVSTHCPARLGKSFGTSGEMLQDGALHIVGEEDRKGAGILHVAVGCPIFSFWRKGGTQEEVFAEDDAYIERRPSSGGVRNARPGNRVTYSKQRDSNRFPVHCRAQLFRHGSQIDRFELFEIARVRLFEDTE